MLDLRLWSGFGSHSYPVVSGGELGSLTLRSDERAFLSAATYEEFSFLHTEARLTVNEIFGLLDVQIAQLQKPKAILPA